MKIKQDINLYLDKPNQTVYAFKRHDFIFISRGNKISAKFHIFVTFGNVALQSFDCVSTLAKI